MRLLSCLKTQVNGPLHQVRGGGRGGTKQGGWGSKPEYPVKSDSDRAGDNDRGTVAGDNARAWQEIMPEQGDNDRTEGQ